ncbi:MAG: S9 family peptidase [Rhizomicrobium sp.]|jgi:dipeptidyl aminopeptidase/acylaminoacyl peptidase
MRLLGVTWVAAGLVVWAAAQAAPQRLLQLDDLYRMHDVGDPQISPAGDWIAYTVRSIDAKADKATTHIWMTSVDGSKTVQLTGRDKESESHPRFSPDGRYLAFLSSRSDDRHNDQLWLMDRLGGEAQKVTDLKAGVNGFAWSPDGKRIALVAEDEDKDEPDPDDKDKTAKPIVIDRFRFMQDVVGYLGKRRDHLYVLDLADRQLSALTSGEFDEELPSWSPDGKSIAFVSKRQKDVDRNNNWDIFIIAAAKGAQARQLTTFPGADNAPDDFGGGSPLAFSPDGKSIAYWQGGDPKLIEYATNKLAVISVSGGAARILTPTLDRNIGFPVWSDDGKSIEFLVEDDRAQYLARVSASGGAVAHIAGGRDFIAAFSEAHGHHALLIANPLMPATVFAWDGKSAPRQITHQNDWLKDIRLAAVEETSFHSKDGTEVHGFLVKPPNAGGGRLPAILRVHGGPQAQFPLAFSFEWQIIAAHGYAVVAANPRGSTGRGQAYCAAIFADWGDKDVQDELAAVDDAVKKDVADPNRLGAGGWSYGGMLTNYLIASDTRFKAATSGASIADILGGYGNDQYAYDYEMELGQPWKNTNGWMKISYPFLHADRIRTPTLFLGGDKDMNVPLHNGEQMYQALKSMGVDTELVIYPGQFHGIATPSYVKDRLRRYLDWYDAHVNRHG